MGAGVDAVFPAELVRAAVSAGPDFYPPAARSTYAVACDPAFTGDAFGLVVGHRDGDRVVVDLVRGWHGRTRTRDDRPDARRDRRHRRRLRAGAGLHRPVRRRGDPPGSGVRGVAVLARPWTNDSKIDAVAAVRRCLYAGALELPDHRLLLAELIGLEQRLLPSGRPRISAGGGGHDDYAMGAARPRPRARREPAHRRVDRLHPRRLALPAVRA